jgi:hypothetical protein
MRHCLVLQQPMPVGDEQEAQREAAEGARSEAWQALDDMGRAAFSAWRRVRGQVSILNPNATKADNMVTVLDSHAVIWSMGAEGIPVSAQATAWDHIMAAHDIEYHGAENLTRLCIAHILSGERELADPNCRKCRRSLGLGVEDSH